MRRLAECDMCILKPERCHYWQGTCRDDDWAHAHCMQQHIVYLANTSDIKVGITRLSQVPTRWIDQGAIQALPIYKVKNRYHSGLVEVAIKEAMNDKTNWRAMLKGDPESVDLISHRKAVQERIKNQLTSIEDTVPGESIEILDDESVVEITYPVEQYLEKIKTLNLDSEQTISKKLMGIKGQYLIFDDSVMNVRKFTGYRVRVEW